VSQADEDQKTIRALLMHMGESKMGPNLSRLSGKLTAYAKLVEIGALQIWIASMMLGVFYAAATVHVMPTLLQLLAGFLGHFLVLCYVMVVNDYYDLEIDKMKPGFTNEIVRSILSKKGQILGKTVSVREGKLFILFSLSVGLLLSLFASLQMFIVTLLIVCLGTLYSVPPIRYKEIYPLSTIGDIMGGALPFVAGYAIACPVRPEAVVVSMIPLLICTYHRLKHEILMVEFDRLTGKKTLAVVNGTRVASIVRKISPILVLLEVLFGFLAGWFPVSFLLILPAYFFLCFGFWSPLLPSLGKKLFGTFWSFGFAVIVGLLIL
jgi:4-hydroxybenzoate polyprenyltransferase